MTVTQTEERPKTTNYPGMPSPVGNDGANLKEENRRLKEENAHLKALLRRIRAMTVCD